MPGLVSIVHTRRAYQCSILGIIAVCIAMELESGSLVCVRRTARGGQGGVGSRPTPLTAPYAMLLPRVFCRTPCSRRLRGRRALFVRSSPQPTPDCPHIWGDFSWFQCAAAYFPVHVLEMRQHVFPHPHQGCGELVDYVNLPHTSCRCRDMHRRMSNYVNTNAGSNTLR